MRTVFATRLVDWVASDTIGAMAEFERELIRERVKAGMKNGKAKGKKMGRPSKKINPETIARLRKEAVTWRAIAQQLGVGVGTLYRVASTSTI
jgi:putative DNA-invertase from lambdoid prophage Rac